MDTKSFPFELKGLTDEGTFEGYLSTYDLDECNDQVVPGAFRKTLSEWRKKKVPIPLLWMHDTNQPVGYLEGEEDEKGLRVNGTLLLELQRARDAHVLLKAKVLNSLSIGYKCIKNKLSDNINKLLEVRLYEGSTVLWPMNGQAIVTGVKKLDDDLLYRLKALEEKLLALTGASDTDVVNAVSRHQPAEPPLIPMEPGVHSVEEIKALLDKLTEIEMRFKS